MNANIQIRPAHSEDCDLILGLYRRAVGLPGCTWDEEYPGRLNIDEDLASGGLYVLIEDGELIGAASIVGENELDGLGCFRSELPHRELARITISPERRGRGYARLLCEYLLDRLAAEGCESVRLLAAKVNTSAVRLYRSLGFDFVGECELYGGEYFACEKRL